MESWVLWFSLAGTAVFALSGALMALRQGMDVVGVSLIATVTGIGGGTMRDLFLGKIPLGWVTEPLPVGICIVVAIAACFLNQNIIGKRLAWLLYADAAGLALFAVLGAGAAEQVGAHPVVAVLFGAMSASFGGIIRDVICNQTPLLLKQEIYITAAALGAFIYVVFPTVTGEEVRALISATPAFLIRVLAIRYNWRLNFPKARGPSEE